MLISVAIPTYSRPDYLKKTIQSCLDQDFDNFEVIVSDDGPNPETRKVVESFHSPRLRYIRLEKPIGLSPKLDSFLDSARGDWLVILGDDDSFEPGYLSAMARIVRKHPEAALVRTRYRYFLDKNFLKLSPDEPYRQESWDFLNVIFLPWHNRMAHIAGVLFPRKKLRELGGFLLTDHGWNVDTAAWAWLGSQGPCYFESTPLVNLRLADDFGLKKSQTDYNRYLEIKVVFFESMKEMFRRAEAAAPHEAARRRLSSAKRLLVKYWMREESKEWIDRAFSQLLQSDKTSVKEEVNSAMHTLKSSGLPLHSPRYDFFRMLGSLPKKPRHVALKAVFKGSSLRKKLFPPKSQTFFLKEAS